MNSSSYKKISWIDSEAELRYDCLKMAIEVTDNPNATIDAARVFEAYIVDNLFSDDMKSVHLHINKNANDSTGDENVSSRTS